MLTSKEGVIISISLFERFRKLLRLFITIILYLMVAVVTLQIITRYLFFYSIPWSEELSRYLFAWLIFLGASIGVKEAIEIRIDIIDSFVKGTSKKVIEVIQLCVTVGVVTLLMFSSFQLVRNGSNQLSPAMQIPMPVVYICITLGMILVAIEALIRLYKILFTKSADSDKHDKEEKEGDIRI